MYNSGTLNTFTKYCFQNLLIIPTETLYPLNYISPAPPAAPHPPTHFLGACVLLSISMNAPGLGLSYTWTHKVLACFLCGLFHLGDVSKVHLCIRVSFLCKLCVMDRAETLNSELSLASSLPPGSLLVQWSPTPQAELGLPASACPPLSWEHRATFQALLSSSSCCPSWCGADTHVSLGPHHSPPPLSASGGSGFAERQKQGI